MKNAGVATAAAGLALLAWTSAFAHAEPARVTPGDGAVVTMAPSEVAIVMTQEMAREAGQNDIDVFDPSGKEVTTVPAVIDSADRRRISVALPSSLAPGPYTVKWKTKSADDGDSAEGSLAFTFDPGGTPAPGREILKSLPGATASREPESQRVSFGQPDNAGLSWVLVVAVGAGSAVVGAGVTFLLVQKRQ